MLKSSRPTPLVILAMLLVSGLALGVSGSGGTREDSRDQMFAKLAETVPGFGGMFFEGRVLNVYLLEPSDSAQRAALKKGIVESFSPEGFTLRVRTLRGKYRFSQLQDWQVRANALLNIPGVTMTDNDERNNRLTVGLETIEARGQVQKELGPLGIPAEAVNFEETGPFVAVQTLRSQVRPVMGGLQIRWTSGASAFLCTLGFVATLPGEPDTPGFVTNSHCTAERSVVEETTYWQPSLPDDNIIGSEILDPSFLTSSEDPSCPLFRMCRYSDSAFASLTAEGTQGGVAQTALGSLTIEGTYRVVGRRQAIVGETLNKVGRTTGRTEGPVQNTCVNTNVAFSLITMLCQDRVAAGVGSGDSGSPVFAVTDTPDPNDVELAGILWGSGGGTFVYSPIANVEWELGTLRVCDPSVSCLGDP